MTQNPYTGPGFRPNLRAGDPVAVPYQLCFRPHLSFNMQTGCYGSNVLGLEDIQASIGGEVSNDVHGVVMSDYGEPSPGDMMQVSDLYCTPLAIPQHQFPKETETKRNINQSNTQTHTQLPIHANTYTPRHPSNQTGTSNPISCACWATDFK